MVAVICNGSQLSVIPLVSENEPPKQASEPTFQVVPTQRKRIAIDEPQPPRLTLPIQFEPPS
jgi:hypothetical protein